jgi:hypothetical protein
MNAKDLLNIDKLDKKWRFKGSFMFSISEKYAPLWFSGASKGCSQVAFV